MTFFTLVVSNLLGRPIRSLLTVGGLAVAVGAVVALVGVARGFEQSLRRAFESRGVDLLVTQGGKLQQTSSVLPVEVADRIAALPGVEQASPTLADVVSLNGDDLLGVPIQGWPAESFALRQIEVTAGEPLADTAPRRVLLGRALADALGVGVGDSVDVLEGEPFEVGGVFESSNVFENGTMMMRLADLQELMLREGEATGVAVNAREHTPEALAGLKAEIESLGDGVSGGLRAAVAREFAEKSPEMRVARSLAWMTSSIALVVGAVGILNTMLMSVFERTREIAMMRAVGWRRGRVLRMVLGEALLLSLAGAAVGAVGAVVVTRLLSQTAEGGRLISGHIAPGVVLQGFGVAVVLGLLGGFYPAWRAARLQPVDGLRHD